MKRALTMAVTLAIVLVTAGASHAVSLSYLLNGGSITAGDKLFDNWSLLNYDTSDASRSFNADNIDVTALDDGGLNPGPGLSFSVSNNELTITGDDLYAYVDLMYGFRVSVLDPALMITDNSLAYSPAGAYWSITVDGDYDTGSYIGESVGTAAGLEDLGAKNIEFSVLEVGSGGRSTISKVSDFVAFDPQSTIWVTSNILVWAVDSTDCAGITGYEQRFSQTAAVPEPSTMLLLGSGLLGLVGLNRRRRA